MSNYDQMIDAKDGSISREIFVNEGIFRDELDSLFTRVWLFVGHESQIPKPGDFFESRMGEESVFLCRDRERQIHVFLNTCRHRGMKVCRYDEGNTPLFTCPYHAWSYSIDGKLVGVPMSISSMTASRSLAMGLDRSRADGELQRAIFATWDPQAPSFEDYLGDARASRHPARLPRRTPRRLRSLRRHSEWIVPSNWKFGDRKLHGRHLSQRQPSVRRSRRHQPERPLGRQRAGATSKIAGSQHFWFAFPKGTASTAMLPRGQLVLEAFRDSPVVEEYFRHCYEERKSRLGTKSRWCRLVGTIFPNTSFHAHQPRALFVLASARAASMEIWRFFLVDRDAPEEVKDFLRHYYMRYSGPAGMTEQDDMENWNYATAASPGTIARRYPYNYQQSMNASKRPGARRREHADHRAKLAQLLSALGRLRERGRQHGRPGRHRHRRNVGHRQHRARPGAPRTGVVAFGPDAAQAVEHRSRAVPGAPERSRGRKISMRRARRRRIERRTSPASWTTPSTVTGASTRSSTMPRSARWARSGYPRRPVGPHHRGQPERPVPLLQGRVALHDRAGRRPDREHRFGCGLGQAEYVRLSASKGGVFAFSAALAYDYFHQRIRVNTVVPGAAGCRPA